MEEGKHAATRAPAAEAAVPSSPDRAKKPPLRRASPPVRRARQQNVKASADCAAAFAAIATAQGFSKAALFKDMVAERLHQLEQKGVKVTVG
jgi:hypothetical protein